jgi:hypothetical protein
MLGLPDRQVDGLALVVTMSDHSALVIHYVPTIVRFVVIDMKGVLRTGLSLSAHEAPSRLFSGYCRPFSRPCVRRRLFSWSFSLHTQLRIFALPRHGRDPAPDLSLSVLPFSLQPWGFSRPSSSDTTARESLSSRRKPNESVVMDFMLPCTPRFLRPPLTSRALCPTYRELGRRRSRCGMQPTEYKRMNACLMFLSPLAARATFPRR